MYDTRLSLIGQWRRKIAGKFGRSEHWIARLLGMGLGFNFWYYRDYIAGILMTMWILYWTSHTIEKKVYGRYSYK